MQQPQSVKQQNVESQQQIEKVTYARRKLKT